VIHKRGVPLTDSDWSGLPLWVGHFPSVGKIEGVASETSHTVLLWTGGTSHVDLAYRDVEGRRRERRFSRASGMMDVLPGGMSVDQVRWRNDGLGSSCVAVKFPAGSVHQLLGSNDGAFPEYVAERFAISDPHVTDLITRLQAQVAGGNPLGAAYAQGLSLTLASYLFASHRPGTAARPSGTMGRLQTEALMVFLEDHLAEDIGLVDMAAVVGYSPHHFTRLFRQAFGSSPYQYLLSRRVERAKAMLRDASLPIAVIAGACGFTSQSHLNSVFKRLTGATPGRYRRG